jgi:hypothetical protein
MIMDCYALKMSLGLDLNKNAQFILNSYFLGGLLHFLFNKST